MAIKTAIGKAIGKIILMGEHAVVYGQPALAMPFPETKIKTVLSQKTGSVTLDCYFFRGLLAHAPDKLLGLTTIIKKIVEGFHEKLEGFSIKIESSIPPERGMGSSAAVAVATIRALYDFFGRPLTKEKLLMWTNVSEKIVHGNPSGIDAAIVAGETALYYTKGRPFVPFPFTLDAHLIVADSGELGQTQEAVLGVKEFIESNPQKGEALIEELGLLAEEAKKFIENNDAEKLGELMNRAHFILDELGVSNESLNRLVSAATKSGALGAKLTGGGRGGCIIALASDREKAEAISGKLLESGAKNTWIYDMGVGQR